jgi:hypothetical protein
MRPDAELFFISGKPDAIMQIPGLERDAPNSGRWPTLLW